MKRLTSDPATRKSGGMRLSKPVNAPVHRGASDEWSAEVLALAGAWKDLDFPSAEELRADQGKDRPREAF